MRNFVTTALDIDIKKCNDRESKIAGRYLWTIPRGMKSFINDPCLNAAVLKSQPILFLVRPFFHKWCGVD